MNNEGNYVATELSIGNPCKFLALLFCLTQFVPLRLSGIELKSASSYAVIRFHLLSVERELYSSMWTKSSFINLEISCRA